jgi:hypothetical protein
MCDNRQPPCYSGGTTTKGDPDFASSSNPYNLFGWISFWNYAWSQLQGGGNTGGGVPTFSVTSTAEPLSGNSQQPPKPGNETCAAQRLASGIFGAVNLGLAAYKAQELPLVVAGLVSRPRSI